MIEIGCAWLSKPTELKSGWASLAGGEPFRFTEADYLRSKGPIWITQSPQKAFLAEGGGRAPWLRHAEFFPTPIDFLAEELAVKDSPQRAVQVLSEVLTRAVRMCCEIAPGLEQFLLDSQLAHCSLHELMQLVIAPIGRKIDVPADLQESLHKLFSGYLQKDAAAFHDLIVRVPAARVDLFEDVMSRSVPGDTWVEIPEDRFPNPLTWAAKGGHQIIANVSIGNRLRHPKEKDKDLVGRDLVVFHGIKAGTRRWMALPEIMALSKLFELKSERTFLCEQIVPVSATLKVAPPIFSPIARASISAGLAAEAFLSAAAMPSPILSASSDGKVAASPYCIRSIWMTSLIRANMIETAIEASKAQVAVMGLGTNHLMVGCKKEKLRWLRLAVNRNSMLSYPSGVRAMEEKYAPKAKAILSTDAYAEDDGQDDGGRE